MFWIIEEKWQLDKLSYSKPCYISIIPLNHNYHPTLTSPSLIYYKCEGEKGHILCINHNDSFEINIELIKNFILKHPLIYCLNKKDSIHYLGQEFNKNYVIDINLLHLENNLEKLHIPSYKSIMAGHIENSYLSHSKLNSFIPLTKHYEEQELIYNDLKQYINKIPSNDFYNNKFIEVLYKIEKEGININRNSFDEHYFIKRPKLSIKDQKIYSQYNLYNFTSRPSNSFNSINFAAMNKSDNTREFIIPKDGWLFEFDYDAYHLRLIAKLINYQFSEDSVHTELGKMYFNKEELTKEEYKESKFISFRQMYGNIYKKYEHIEFFQKTKQFIKELWELSNKQGYLKLKGGRKLNLENIQEPNPSKLFNYLIQSMETYYNIISIKKVLDYLDNKKSSCILYTYDSILINFSQDDKEVLKDIKLLMESEGFKISVSYGKNYNNLKEI